MNNQFKNLKVSVLSKSLQTAKDISMALRSFDIYANIYVNLDEFLIGYKKNDYDLNVVDINSIFQGSLNLKDHSSFKSNKMKVSFYYDKDSRVHLSSIYGQDFYGLINKGPILKSQLSSLLSIIKREKQSEESVDILKKEIRSLSQKNLKLERESISSGESITCYESFTQFLNGLKGSSDFLSKFSSSLNNWDDCYKFSLLNYNQKSKRLQSLNLSLDKYKILPSMEISKSAIHRDNFFQMLESAYEEQLGPNIKVISVSVDNHLLLVGQFSSDLKEERAWDYFSNSLSLISNDNFELPNLSDEKEFLNFLESVDDQYFNKSKSDTKYLTIDLKPLVSLITSNYTSRFYWADFITSFENTLSASHEIEIEIVRCGTLSIYVGVEGLRLKETYDMLKEKVKSFHYWDFFEDKSLAFSSKSYPTINLTPTSSSGIMRALADQGRINLSNQLMN